MNAEPLAEVREHIQFRLSCANLPLCPSRLGDTAYERRHFHLAACSAKGAKALRKLC